MLEKDNHFTGDGIWSNEQNVKQQSLQVQKTTEKSDDNTSTVKVNDNLSIENNDG